MSGTAVVAVASNGVIGRDNDLPWRLPDDLKRFKALTMGRTLLMGRRTFDSIGRPLPGRQTVVLTRQTDWKHDGVTVLHTLDQARTLLASQDVVLAGGGELYREFWGEMDRLEITHVHRAVEGDVYLPAIDPAEWQEAAREDRPEFSWVTYQRRKD